MRKFTIMLALLLAALPTLVLHAQTPGSSPAVNRAIAYIRTQQQPDGTFKGFGAGSTADAIYALAAAGLQPAAFKNGGASALAGLRKLAPEATKQTGLAAKFLLAAELAGDDQLAQTMRQAVAAAYTPATGLFAKDPTSQALAILAQAPDLKDAPVPAAPLRALKALQLPDGGWSFDGSAATGSDTNTTALVLQALSVTEGGSAPVLKGIAYLKAQQNADAGFPYSQTSQYGHDSDANSTAYVIQGLLAAGEDLQNWARNGKTPIDRLLAFQNKSGAFRFQDTQPADNAGATYQAVPALLTQTYPYVGIAHPGVTGPVVATPSPAPHATPTRTPKPPTPAGAPAQLPNTGADDTRWLLLVVASALLMSGWSSTRRRHS
ncbi:MAG: terpene cyclase/mutase family protein [Herpetosiphonaceae bacterium]|nr:terpene cyclase/mutase family protein [Herpetosiphonaceae bacterium]